MALQASSNTYLTGVTTATKNAPVQRFDERKRSMRRKRNIRQEERTGSAPVRRAAVLRQMAGITSLALPHLCSEETPCAT